MSGLVLFTRKIHESKKSLRVNARSRYKEEEETEKGLIMIAPSMVVVKELPCISYNTISVWPIVCYEVGHHSAISPKRQIEFTKGFCKLPIYFSKKHLVVGKGYLVVNQPKFVIHHLVIEGLIGPA